MMKVKRVLGIMIALIAVSACLPTQPSPPVLPTSVSVARTLAPPSPSPSTAAVGEGLPATWTPSALSLLTSTPFAPLDFTPRPSATPWPTLTATVRPTTAPPPTDTPAPPPPATANPSPVPTNTISPVAAGRNLLPNPSFEEGWYHPNGDPELQVPNRWRFEFEEGANSLDPDPWNGWVRPEVRVLNPDFLPPQEHDLFIWDGRQTVKIFKGQGAIHIRLLTEVDLQPGTYQLTVQVFPDLVEGYTAGGGKIWASDELSGEVSLWTGAQRQPWQLPEFGRRNTFRQTFTVDQPGPVTVGVALRGRWAILNNGWFLDDWELIRIS